MSSEIKEQHPSYGFIRINNPQGGHGRLFMSPLRHDHRISIEIGPATYYRDLSTDGHHAGRPLIKVEMSAEQFARFITSGSTHNGVPCTITRRENECIEAPPGEVKSEKWYAEMRDTTAAATKAIEATREKILPLIEKLPKAKQEQILAALGGVERIISDHLPWIVQSMHEGMDKIVNSAKIEFEGYANRRIAEIQAAGGTLTDAAPVLAISDSSTIDKATP